MNHFKMKKP